MRNPKFIAFMLLCSALFNLYQGAKIAALMRDLWECCGIAL